MLFHYIANFICVTSGLILFGLGVYGLTDERALQPHVLTELLRPSGFGTIFDRIHLGILAVLGFWLTIGLYVRIPAAIALALVLGKLMLVGENMSFDRLIVLSLAMAAFATMLRLITSPPPTRESEQNDWMW